MLYIKNLRYRKLEWKRDRDTQILWYVVQVAPDEPRYIGRSEGLSADSAFKRVDVVIWIRAPYRLLLPLNFDSLRGWASSRAVNNPKVGKYSNQERPGSKEQRLRYEAAAKLGRKPTYLAIIVFIARTVQPFCFSQLHYPSKNIW